MHVQDAMEFAGELYRSSKFSEAECIFRQIIEHDPYNFHAHSALSVSLIEQQKCNEALPYLDKAGVLLRDEMVSVSCNRGRALADLGRSQEALDLFNSILKAYPTHILSYYNRGLVLLQMGKHEEAIADMNRVLTAEPDNGKARFGRGFAHLVLGEYRQGFIDYECRQKDEIDELNVALWTGSEDLKGKSILVYGEMGLGDNIMFGRYLPKMVERGAKVYVWVPECLRSLICAIPGVSWYNKENPPKLDYWVRFMSLALAFGTTVDAIPPPMLITQSKKVRTCDQRKRIKIGLCWSGSRTSRYDEYRSIPLKLLKPLLACDANFVSLQLDVRESDQEDFTESKLWDTRGTIKDFTDTAAIMSQLDLVITVDTSVAHLAGTVGVPTIVMLTAYRTYWLWISKMLTSPWYPSIGLVRQPTDGDWKSVVHAVVQDVRRRIAERG